MPDTDTDVTTDTSSDNPTGDNVPPVEPGDVTSLPEWAQKKITELNNEAANYRVRARDARATAEAEVKAQYETQISELTSKHDSVLTELDTARLSNTKLTVALGTGLPGKQALDFADILAGTNESEIKSHAERLAKVTKFGNAAFDPSQGLGGGADVPAGDLFQNFVLGQLDGRS